MLPTFRRPPPGATDVLAKLAPWFPKGFAAGRAQFDAPAQTLDTEQLGAPVLETHMRDGTPLAVFRNRLHDANAYVRVGLLYLMPIVIQIVKSYRLYAAERREM